MQGLLLLAMLLSHDDGDARDRFKNPKDLEGYIAAQEAPSRAAWQKPEEVLDALALAPGQTVCDIGAGPGYFALRAAKRVGPRGHVFAVDVEPRIWTPCARASRKPASATSPRCWRWPRIRCCRRRAAT